MIIIRRNYSCLDRGGYEEQREFGVKRALKVTIGRARRNIADSLYASGTNRVIRAGQAVEQLANNSVHNKELRNKLLRNEASRLGTTVSYNADNLARTGGGAVTISKGSIRGARMEQQLGSPYVPKGEKKFIKSILKKENRPAGVALSKNSGVDMLAHELGHVEGRVAGGKRGKIQAADPRFSQGASYQGSLSNFRKKEGRNLSTERVSFKEAIKDHIANQRAARGIVGEEQAASKAGLRMLKKAGATKGELQQAKVNLNVGSESYKAVKNKISKSGLGRIIDIPSRRGMKEIVM